MHGTLPLQQSHYSTYSTVLRPITLKVCSIYNEKGFFFYTTPSHIQTCRCPFNSCTSLNIRLGYKKNKVIFKKTYPIEQVIDRDTRGTSAKRESTRVSPKWSPSELVYSVSLCSFNPPVLQAKFVQSQFSYMTEFHRCKHELIFPRNSDVIRNVGDLVDLNSDLSFPK